MQLSETYIGRQTGDGARVWEVHFFPGYTQYILASHNYHCGTRGSSVSSSGFHCFVGMLPSGCDYKDHSKDTRSHPAYCRCKCSRSSSYPYVISCSK
ncbi:hypothetical protein CEXT_268221 [Caerostris extrusa]|uniref:Uncharacterized protein n=1 Tax=Caerostris extrusa TaxID=172846 RepID=A0AAV4W7A9_CAEEX|nr:hypothetical protein CEXT_268221 [Caerostris extrusa]